MKKTGDTVRHAAEEIDRMLARGESRTDWAAVNRTTEEDLERGIAGARKATMAGVGHMANLEAPEAFNRIVRQFLETTLG